MTDILPCPFCGGNKIEPYQEFERAKWGRMMCAECGAMGSDVRTGYAGPELWRDKAAVEWNRRAGPSDEDVERVAQALLDRRGFGFYLDPMEGGQDAYDITLDALEEARAAIAALRAKP